MVEWVNEFYHEKTGCKAWAGFGILSPNVIAFSSPIEMPDWRADWCQYL